MTTVRARAGLIPALLVWLWAASSVAAEELLVLATPENSVDTVIGEVIVREAYHRLGIDVMIKKYPAERAVRLADQGEVDGEVQRVAGLSERYPHLIQVQPAINFIEATVFSKTTDFPVDGWESLSPHRIGLIRGIKFAEQNTQGMSVAPADGYDTLFRLLDRGRVDIALSPRVNGWYHLRRMGMEGIHTLEPSVAVVDLYHYVHRKHADLVPQISAMFSRMRASGELPRIRARVVDILLERAARNLGPCDDDYSCFDPPPSDP
jgi:ABC-type amino acid transport substrate-binding protein